MRAQKVVSRKTALGSIGLCVVLSVVVIGFLVQDSNVNLLNQAASKDVIIKSLNSTVSTLNATVIKDNSTIDSLNAQIASLQKQVKSESLVNSALQTQAKSTTSQLNSETSEVNSLQKEINGNQISTGQVQMANLQSQVASQQSTITSLSSNVANLETTMANWEAPVTDGFSLIQITDTQYLSESNPALFNTAAAASAFSFLKSASRMCFPELTLRAIATPINPDPINTVTLFMTTSRSNGLRELRHLSNDI